MLDFINIDWANPIIIGIAVGLAVVVVVISLALSLTK